MMAFDEAIRRYEIGKGGFLSFAKRVIGRRLIDNYRKSNPANNAVAVDFSNKRDYRIKDYDAKLADEAYGIKREEEDRLEEIEIYKRELGAWGISFSELVKNSPKHDRLRREYKEIATWMTVDDNLMDELMRTHRLPINKIIEKRKIPRKKLERGRIYILSLIVVLTGDYRFIREYIDWR
jgi:RNA polymerase sigma factor